MNAPAVIGIGEGLRLRRFDGIEQVSLKWYEDEETVYLVDGVRKKYTPETLRDMYTYLDAHGELYWIEKDEGSGFFPIGDVTLCEDDLPIVIGDRRYRGRGIGVRVLRALIARALEAGWTRLSVREIYRWNAASRRLFTRMGFEERNATEKGNSYSLILRDAQGRDAKELYRALDRDLADLYYRVTSDRDYETEPFVPDEAALNGALNEARALRGRIALLPVPGLPYAALKAHFRDFLDALDRRLGRLEKDPYAAFEVFIHRYARMEQDRREPAEKDRVLIALYGRLAAVSSGVLARIGGASAGDIKNAADRLRGSAEDIRHAQFDAENVRLAMEQAARDMEAAARELEKHLPDVLPQAAGRLTYEEFRDILRRERGVDPDDLEAWGFEAADGTRKRCFALAEELARRFDEEVPRDMESVNALLLKYAGPASSPEEMFERSKGYLARTRALARSILPLPEGEECLLTQVPWEIRYSFPWGGYSDGDTTALPPIGRMFLNGYNYTAVTDGWMKINCLHEAYPGHHVQFARTTADPIPHTCKIGARSIPLLEGMCHRTEDVYAYVYSEDPFYPLFAAYRRHHTAVRIRADLMLYRDRADEETVAAMYERELGFDHVTAMGQVKAHLDMPGYFSCYYYGCRRILDMEKKYGFERDEYTRLLFSLSNVSLDTFEMLLEMTEDERKVFLNDFAG